MRRMEKKTFYDITICQKSVEMFDHYYDKYKTGLKGWKQTMEKVILNYGMESRTRQENNI